jgi:hypothetical protein
MFAPLRFVGLVVALALLIVAARRWNRRSLRLTDALIMALLGAGLGIVALKPSWVDPVLRELGFPPGDARRVIGVLVVANFLAFVLLLRAFARSDRLEQVLGDHADRVAARWFEREYGGAQPGRGVVATVIPAFNEEGSISDVLSALPHEIAGMKVEPIVVSDGSSDATERVARAHGALVVGRDVRRGQGAAVALGYRVALLRGADVVATLDADGQYDPLELPRLIKPIVDGEADVVHGSRALGAYERPLVGRSHGLKVFAWILSRIARAPITDPASGFRAFTPDALRVLEFKENQFHASEVTIAAAKSGLRLKEVPCTFRERFAGTTKKPPLFRYGYGYARTVLRTWLG